MCIDVNVAHSIVRSVAPPPGVEIPLGGSENTRAANKLSPHVTVACLVRSLWGSKWLALPAKMPSLLLVPGLSWIEHRAMDLIISRHKGWLHLPMMAIFLTFHGHK